MSNAIHGSVSSIPDSDEIRVAQSLLKQDRAKGVTALNELFRKGAPPNPTVDGPYDGELVAVSIAPGVTQLVEWLTSFVMPWKGKFLIAKDARGDNIFGRGYRSLLSVLFPFYRDFVNYDADSFRGFVFQTRQGPGLVDPDRQVFKIEYDVPDNPVLTIQRIVDELVQIKPGVYLGKIHFKWWWGTNQMIGYFSLRSPR